VDRLSFAGLLQTSLNLYGKNNVPHVIVIAGPNGAGKSTTAPAILKGALGVTEFVNADTIAQGLSALILKKQHSMPDE